MSVIVCLGAGALSYPLGGGHLSVYLNWALGLRAAGCEVIWLEIAEEGSSVTELLANVATLKGRLERFGSHHRSAGSPPGTGQVVAALGY